MEVEGPTLSWCVYSVTNIVQKKKKLNGASPRCFVPDSMLNIEIMISKVKYPG